MLLKRTGGFCSGTSHDGSVTGQTAAGAEAEGDPLVSGPLARATSGLLKGGEIYKEKKEEGYSGLFFLVFVMTKRHPRTIKISSCSLSPNCLGERERVRGHLADILCITPHLYPLPSRGEEHRGDLFSWQWTSCCSKVCINACQAPDDHYGTDRMSELWIVSRPYFLPFFAWQSVHPMGPLCIFLWQPMHWP